MKIFTEEDIFERSGFKRINAEREELVHDPLPWQQAGLQQTATGYGRKLTDSRKINLNGKFYRLYVTCFSNVASVWFTRKGERIYVS